MNLHHLPSTKIRFEHNPLMALAHLGGDCVVWCPLPGGRPQFQLHPGSHHSAPVDGAPRCDTFATFKTFVSERWGDAV